jgi:hypothetical protein
MKLCGKCKIEKEINEFHKNKNCKDGLAYWCKDCCKNYRISNIEIYIKYWEAHREQHDKSRKRWYKAHRQQCINYAREYQKAHKDQYSTYVRQYLDVNKDRIKMKHKEWITNNRGRCKMKINEWKTNNNGRCRVYWQKIRALKRSLPSTLTAQQWEQITQRFNDKCAYCGKTKTLQQDHFVPLVKGGEYTHNNILPACKDCNQSKHTTSFFNWYPKQKFYSKEREVKILKFLNYDNGIQQLSMFEIK